MRFIATVLVSTWAVFVSSKNWILKIKKIFVCEKISQEQLNLATASIKTYGSSNTHHISNFLFSEGYNNNSYALYSATTSPVFSDSSNELVSSMEHTVLRDFLGASVCPKGINTEKNKTIIHMMAMATFRGHHYKQQRSDSFLDCIMSSY